VESTQHPSLGVQPPDPSEARVSPWLRIDEAAAHCRVSKQQLFRAARERKIEHIRVGGRRTVLTTREWCDAWLNSLRVHVAPAR
jgi:excisionase family DNA binding protein